MQQQRPSHVRRFLSLDELKKLEELDIPYVFLPNQNVPEEALGLTRRHVVGITPADWAKATQKEHKAQTQSFGFEPPKQSFGFEPPKQQQQPSFGFGFG